MKIKFHTVIWGREYMDFFFKVCMPFTIRELSKVDCQPEFIFNTIIPDAYRIKDEMKGLNYSIYAFDKERIIEPQVILFECVQKFIEMNAGKDCYIKILGADVLYYGMSNMINLLKKHPKYKAAALPIGAIRVDREQWEKKYKGEHTIEELFLLTMETMHQETKDHFITSKRFHPYPAMILAPNINGLRVNSFIAQPSFMKPNRYVPFTNPEYDLLNNNFAIEDVYIVNDMHEAFDISPAPAYANWSENTFTPEKMSEFIKTKDLNPFMRRCFEHGFNKSDYPEHMDEIVKQVMGGIK